MEISVADWERDRAEVEAELPSIYPPISEVDFDEIDPFDTPEARLRELMASREYAEWRGGAL